MRIAAGPSRPIAAAAFAAWVAGCASGQALDAAYERSLARWKGAPSLLLLASWGAPNLEEKLPDGSVRLVFVVRHELARPPAGPTVVVGNGKAAVVDAAPPPPGLQPVFCTTRFVLRDDIVAAWDFSGEGCGAP